MLILVPKEFILPTCIKQRKPLSKKAKRAGWTGCNILLNAIPDKGKIYAIRQKKVIEKDKVRNNIVSIDFIRKIKNLESRGWLNDILLMVSNIKSEVFTLKDVYRYESVLKKLHPNNNHIRAKIRQQLQILRDNNLIEFVDRGVYKKVQT